MSKAWPLVKLGEVLQKSQNWIELDPQKEYKEVTVRLWGKGVTLRGIVTGSQIAGSRRLQVHSNQFILSRIDARNGAFGLIPDELDNAVVSNDFPVFDIHQNRLLPKYLHWLSKTNNFVESCKTVSEGTTNRVRLKEEKFLQITIPLPPFAEQQRIVARIERLAGKIEEAHKLRQNIRDNNAKLLVAMAHRTDLTNADKKSLGWKETVLGELLTLNVDPIHVLPGSLYPTFGIYSFAKGIFSKAPLSGDEVKAKTLYRVHNGQFIYARLNAFEGAFGIITERYDQHFVSNEYPTFDCKKERILPEFITAHFSSSHIWQHFLSKSRGIGSKAGNRRIRVKPDVILEYQLMLPPIEWQQKIKEITEKQKHLKPIQAQTTTELDAMLPSILDEAFKGEL